MLSFEIFFTETILYRALLKNVSYANEIKLTVYSCVSKIWQDTNLLMCKFVFLTNTYNSPYS